MISWRDFQVVEKIECSEVVAKFSIHQLQKIIPLKYEPNIQNKSVMRKIATIFKGNISATLTGKEGNSNSYNYMGAITILLIKSLTW